jgi:hypothetical protein
LKNRITQKGVRQKNPRKKHLCPNEREDRKKTKKTTCPYAKMKKLKRGTGGKNPTK